MSVSAFHQKYNLSPELQAVCDKATELSRPHIVGKLWKYIKAKGLQNKDKKVEIINDDKMKAIFKCDRMTMFEMNKLIKNGFTGPDAKKKGASKRKAKAAHQGSCKSYEPPHHNVYKRKKTGRRFCRKSASGTRKKSNKA